MRFVSFVFFLVFGFSAYGQLPDTLITISTDSLLLPYQQKLDSVQHNFYRQSDSIKTAFKQKLSNLESSRSKLQSQVDSLQALQLPAEKYSQKLDSLKHLQAKTVSDLNQTMEDLKSKTGGRVKELNLPPELQGKVSDLTKNIEGFQLPVKDLNIPALSSPDNPLKSLDGLASDFKSPLGNIGEIDGLSNIQENLGEVSKITEQFSGYQEDLKSITQGNLQEVQQVPKALEEKAASIAGVDELAKQTAVIDPLLEAAKNPEAAKEQIIEQAKEAAIDHFAGKEAELQGAMEKISKLKQKYSSLNSLSEIPKKRPNEMRGKPLIERIVPGIGIQLLRKNDDFLTDLNPYFGYRFTGRLTGGAGWNQRIPYDFDKNIYNRQEVVYGPRLFSEYKLGKGFVPRIEMEMMNVYVPVMVTPGSQEIQTRQWVFGIFVGMKREYKFIKNVKGTALVMLRVFNHDPHSPYSDVMNVRFGFEFPMKKKEKRQG